MSAPKQREIASLGGTAAHAKGTAHVWTSEEAREAGRKGGQAAQARRAEARARAKASLECLADEVERVCEDLASGKAGAKGATEGEGGGA